MTRDSFNGERNVWLESERRNAVIYQRFRICFVNLNTGVVSLMQVAFA